MVFSHSLWCGIGLEPRSLSSRTSVKPRRHRQTNVTRGNGDERMSYGIAEGIWRSTYPLSRGFLAVYPASNAELTASMASPSLDFASVLHCCGDAAAWVPNAVAVLAG